MLRETRAGSTAPTMPRHSAHACCPLRSLMLLACKQSKMSELAVQAPVALLTIEDGLRQSYPHAGRSLQELQTSFTAHREPSD